jgi:hypothetical protein
MSNLRPNIRSTLTSLVTGHDGYHLKVDVLRVIEEEARLMKETQRVYDALDRDDMDQLGKIPSSQLEHLKKHLMVSSYHSVRTLVQGYTRIDAVVDVQWKNNLLQLIFQYERKLRPMVVEDEDINGTHVRYSIKLSKNHQRQKNVLVLEIWSPQDGPSPGKAVCINQSFDKSQDGEEEDDNNGCYDIFEDDNDIVDAAKKNIKTDETGVVNHSNKIKMIQNSVDHTIKSDLPPERVSKRQRCNDESPNQKQDMGLNLDCNQQQIMMHDEYLAYFDADLMHEFTQLIGLDPIINDDTALFLLMSFPFYEYEWDLVGYLLEEIFGIDDEE